MAHKKASNVDRIKEAVTFPPLPLLIEVPTQYFLSEDVAIRYHLSLHPCASHSFFIRVRSSYEPIQFHEAAALSESSITLLRLPSMACPMQTR